MKRISFQRKLLTKIGALKNDATVVGAMATVRSCVCSAFWGRRVNASDQGLLNIPEALWKGASSIGRLKSVKIVDLSMNSLRELPPRFVAYLGAIRKLDLSSNELLSLPVCSHQILIRPWDVACFWLSLAIQQDEIGSLTDLWMLNMKHNRLSSLPPATGSLRKLMWLDISGNAIVELPLGLFIESVQARPRHSSG
jgi:hypothetical protein